MSLPTQTILSAALPVFILLALGFSLRHTGVLSKEADVSIMKLVIRVFYPCLFLDFIIGNPSLNTASNIIAPPIVGFLTTAGGFLLGYLMARALGLKRGGGMRTFSFCCGVYNYGYIPIPLIAVLFADRGTLGVLLVHNVGVEIALWTVGILLLSGQFDRSALKKLINPPLIALAVALSINAVGLDSRIPLWMENLFHMLGACSIPVGILLAGATIGDLLNRQGLQGGLSIPLGAIGIRLALLPLLFIAAAIWTPGLSTELKQVMVVQAAMPAGILPIVLARHYGGDATVAMKVVLTTTFASIVTMPLWLGLGTRWVF